MQMKLSTLLIVVLASELNGLGVNGVITDPPLNTVAEVGGQAILTCTSSTTLQNWIFTAKREDLGTTSAQDIVLGCMVQPGYTTHYEVDRPGGSSNACSLIVKDTTMQQAGVYTCSDSTAGPSALLTVIDQSPTITYNDTQDVVMADENVIITCTLNYNGSVVPAPTLQPYFYWTNPSGQNVSSSYDSTTNNTAVSQLTVTAGRQAIVPYTCHVYLQLTPPAISGYVNNIPSVNCSAISPTIIVLYPPSLPEIVATSSGFVACEAKNLTCYSDGNPPPDYNWVDLTSGNLTNAQKIIAECGVSYTCNALNIIRNAINVKSLMFYEASITNITCKFPRAKNMHISGQTCSYDFCECECNTASILCYVDAFPPPLYEWLLPDGSRVEGQTVEAYISGIFVCRSYKLIDGWYLVEAYKSVNVSGCSYSPITTTYFTDNTSQCSSSETAAIVLGVLLAIAITTNIFSLVLFLRKGAVNQRDSSEPEVTQPTSNSEEPHYQDLFKETLAKPEYEELHH